MLRGEPIRARPVSSAERCVKWARRQPALAVMIALVILVTILGFSGVVWQWRKAVAAQQERTDAHLDALLTAPPEAVPLILDNLKPFRDEVMPRLRADFAREHPDNPQGRLHAAFALAAFDEAPVDFLLDSVPAAQAREAPNFVSALRPALPAVGTQLLQRARAADRAEQRVRFAVLALHLGDTLALRELLAPGPDPAARTAFIHGYPSWHGDPATLPAILTCADDPALRSALCATLGLFPRDALPGRARDELRRVLLDLYRDAPDGATHAAAAWSLRQWQTPLPVLGQFDEPRTGRRWFVNGKAMTLVEIPAGTFTPRAAGEKEPRRPVTLARPFFLSDREVSADLFHQFVRDRDYPAAEKPATDSWKLQQGEAAIHSVTWYEAVLFCNWLSRCEGRRPYYVRGMGKEEILEYGVKTQFDTWECDHAADGYRLPTEVEWEYGCRAGTTTTWAFGEDEDLLPHYAVFLLSSKGAIQPGGTKLPNGWGLFDMHGNAQEWCWDRGGGNAAVASRVLRGGAWLSQANGCGSAFRVAFFAPNKRQTGIGFRVACGLKEK